jgi:hypothetical protein
MFILDKKMFNANSMLFTHGKKELKALEFGTSRLAMLNSNVLS